MGHGLTVERSIKISGASQNTAWSLGKDKEISAKKD